MNDLAVAGAEPAAISVAFILEEGLPIAELRHQAEAMRAAAERAGVRIVAGDTKVVPQGACDNDCTSPPQGWVWFPPGG